MLNGYTIESRKLKHEGGVEMYIYLATGTADFMEHLQAKYKKENMTVLYGGQQSVLMHVTEGKTKFATPQSFEVVEEVGEFEPGGFYAITYIDIFEDSQLSFENRLKSKSFHFVNEPGFIAYKLLKPIKSTVFAIIQQWTGPNSYQVWRDSANYAEDFDFMGSHETDRRPTTLAVAPYTKLYGTAPVEEVEEDRDDRF